MNLTSRFGLAVLFSISLLNISFGQTQSKLALTLHGAMNNSDVNYGSEFIASIVPVDDYNSRGYSGSPGFGFDFGVGATYNITTKLSVPVSLYFGQYGYKVTGDLDDFDPADGRPLNPEFIRAADGQVNYQFVGIQTGATYLFSEDIRKGFNMSLLLDYMIHTGTTWNLDVTYEDDSTGEFDDNSAIEDDDVNNLFTLGLRLGYRVPVGESYSIVPRFTFRGALNPIVADGLNGVFFDLGVTVMRWF